MVKKLLKHELIYYIRIFCLPLLIILAVAVITRICQFFQYDSDMFIVSIFSSALLFMSCMLLLILPTFIGIERFYKHMYTAEGYLTFSLPVTNAQHIFVKLLSTMICSAVCTLTMILAIFIAFSNKEFFAFLPFMFVELAKLFGGLGTVNSIAFILEVLLLSVLSSASNMLSFYACITIGQTANKNRVGMAFLTYFIYYAATQFIVTIATTVGMPLLPIQWMSENPIPTAHIYFCFAILISAAMAAAFWLVTQIIMTKKLNLE